VQTMIGSIEKRIIVEHRSNEVSKRLRSIPGIGIVGASAIVATVLRLGESSQTCCKQESQGC